MRGERVLTLLLEAGDVIHLCHQHDSGCSACLSHWEIDAVVTENPAVVCDRVAVKWAHTARQLLGGRPLPGSACSVRMNRSCGSGGFRWDTYANEGTGCAVAGQAAMAGTLSASAQSGGTR